jgi:hypothetical protein
MNRFLVAIMLLVSVGCGHGNYRGKDEVFTIATGRLTVGVSTPTDALLVLGTPDDSGNRTSANRWLRYNITEGGFMEVGFSNDILSTISFPSTY